MTMKKIIIAGLLVVFASTSAFAAASGGISATFDNAGKSVVGGNDAAVTTPKPIGKLSTGVDLAFITNTTGYAYVTVHKNGVKAFGSAHDSTAITYKTVTKLSAFTAPTTAGSASVSGATWTIM
jgi:hypothetical protein